MTCVACRSETYRNMRPPASNDGEGVVEAVEEVDEEVIEWDDWTDAGFEEED